MSIQKIKVTKNLKKLKPDEIINFKNIEEFNTYYTVHKEEMDAMTTCSINKQFKIPGLWFTKIKGVLQAKSEERQDPLTEYKNEMQETIQEQNERINQLEKQIKALLKALNQMRNQIEQG